TNDLGNSGAGGSLSDTDTLNITVNAVNDAPINTIPGAQLVGEDTDLVFSPGNGNAISIADIDSDPGQLQVTLTATHGLLMLSQITGLTFSLGDGSGDATMTFTGTIANINAALNGLTFSPDLNYNGAATIQLDTNDQGNTGIGGALTASNTINISIGAINDAPVNSIPPPQNTNEDNLLSFTSAGGNAIIVSDPDVGGGILQVTLGA